MADTPTIQQALASVMGEVQTVRKDSRNTAQNFVFRGIDAVMNAVGPALRKHGVVIIPEALAVNYRDVEVGQKRTPMREVTCKVRYTAHGPAGDHVSGVVLGEALDVGDKATAKALSVAYRTFLLQALTIPTDDPDPDAESHERVAAADAVAVDPREHDGLLSEVEDRLVRCAELGIDVDPDTVREYAARKVGNARAAIATLDERLTAHTARPPADSEVPF